MSLEGFPVWVASSQPFLSASLRPARRRPADPHLRRHVKMDTPAAAFKPKKHAAFLVRCLRGMPPSAISLDSNRSVRSHHQASKEEGTPELTHPLCPSSTGRVSRMTLAYFLVASLDLIGALFTDTTEQDRAGWIEWVWDQQLRELTTSIASPLSPTPALTG